MDITITIPDEVYSRILKGVAQQTRWDGTGTKDDHLKRVLVQVLKDLTKASEGAAAAEKARQEAVARTEKELSWQA